MVAPVEWIVGRVGAKRIGKLAFQVDPVRALEVVWLQGTDDDAEAKVERMVRASHLHPLPR